MNKEFHEVAMMAASIWAQTMAEAFADAPDEFGADVASVYETAIDYMTSDEEPEFASAEAETMAGQVLSGLAVRPAK